MSSIQRLPQRVPALERPGEIPSLVDIRNGLQRLSAWAGQAQIKRYPPLPDYRFSKNIKGCGHGHPQLSAYLVKKPFVCFVNSDVDIRLRHLTPPPIQSIYSILKFYHNVNKYFN